MQHPSRWRDTVDPFVLPLRRFRLERVLGYPHAGNDVFHAEGIHDGQRVTAYIKVARQTGADIANEVFMLTHLPLAEKPELLDFSLDEPSCSVTQQREGERLSVLVGENESLQSLPYMAPYGRALARVHRIGLPCAPVKHRRFFDLPAPEHFLRHDLTEWADFLHAHPPAGQSECFVHGDFHYANLLWQGERLSAILDFELSGRGVREFDLAWALLLRPGQKFLNTLGEIRAFLTAYREEQPFSPAAFRYYYVLAAAHFYPMGDSAYRAQLRRLVPLVINLSI